ncbi:MAG: DUF4124 domain-containing protein [Oleiphilaceae bacterium]|nr:DUF4124 domain-containing protein [Oleiphilaceae bacterium]
MSKTKFYRLCRHTLFIATLSTAMTATAGVYKWVDEEGTVHYSDTRPAHVKAESLRVQGTSNRKSSEASDTSPQERAKALDEAEQKRLNDKARELQEETIKRENETRCQVVRDNLDKLNNTSRISVIENGEARYLDEAEIAEKKAQFQAILSNECS